MRLKIYFPFKQNRVAFLQDHRRSSLNISPESFPFVKNLQRKSSQEINLAQNPPKSPLKIPSESLPFNTISSDGVAWKYQRRGNFYRWQAVASWSLIRILNSKQCFPANRSAGKWKVCWRHQIALYIEENRSANDFWSDDGDHWLITMSYQLFSQASDQLFQSNHLRSCFTSRPSWSTLNCDLRKKQL